MHATCTHTHPFLVRNRYHIAGSRYFCSSSAFWYIFSFFLFLFCFSVKKLESLQSWSFNYFYLVFACCINGKTYQVHSPQLLLGMQASCFSAKSKPKVIQVSLKSKTMPVIFIDVNIHIWMFTDTYLSQIDYFVVFDVNEWIKAEERKEKKKSMPPIQFAQHGSQQISVLIIFTIL